MGTPQVHPAHELAHQVGERDRCRGQAVRALSRATEMRDIETAIHSIRVSELCARLARRLGLAEEDVERIRIGSSLHDVGKLGVPDRLLFKPGPLTEVERGEIKLHAELGYEILLGVAGPRMVVAATIALTHHEWYDGSGYPHGLGSEEIPVAGRIVAVADVFDALLSDRPYRPPFTLVDALQLMETERASHFDPEILDLLLAEVEGRGPQQSD